MSSDHSENKLIVRRYIEKIINTGDVSRIGDFISEDYVEEYNGERFSIGIDGAISHVLGVRKTYPDLHLAINHQICEGDWVVTSYMMTGTHKGSWMEIKPTNQKVVIYGVNLDKISNHKIVEHGGAANLLEPLLAINAIELKK